MKKALYCGLSAALLLALVLAACNKPQAEQPAEPDQTQAVTSTPEPEQTPEPVTTPEPPEQTPAAPAQLSSTTQADPDEADPSQPPEETEPQEPAEEGKLFDDVNETVYATGTVNIRASWTANSEKLGSLGTGESVTRTGTPIAGTEAEGWSRVCLADGTTAYISSSYLSTTKPQTQTQAPATNTTKTTNTTQTQQPTSQGGGPGIIDNGLSGGETGGPDGQGLAGMLQWSAEHPADPDSDLIDENYLKNHPNAYIGETGNICDPDIAVNMN